MEEVGKFAGNISSPANFFAHSSNARPCEALILFFLAQRHYILKAVLGNIEKIAVRIGPTGLGIGSSVGTRFGQFVGIDFFQSLDDLFAALHFEAEVIKAVRRLLLMVGQNGEIEVALGQKNR